MPGLSRLSRSAAVNNRAPRNGPSGKGFVYSLAFSSLALVILFSAILFLKDFSKPSSDRLSSQNEIPMDIARDVVSFNNVSFTLSKNGTHTLLVVDDYIPSTLSAPAAKMNAYVSFAEGVLARRTIHNISLATPSSRYILQPFGLTYSHSGLAKAAFSTARVASVSAYSLGVRLNRPCLGNCTAAVSSDWAWQASGLAVSLDVRDSNGAPILVNGQTNGFVSRTSTKTFRVNLTGGSWLNVTLTGAALRVAVSNARAVTETNISLSGTPEAQLILPLDLSVDGANYSGVVLMQK